MQNEAPLAPAVRSPVGWVLRHGGVAPSHQGGSLRERRLAPGSQERPRSSGNCEVHCHGSQRRAWRGGSASETVCQNGPDRSSVRLQNLPHLIHHVAPRDIGRSASGLGRWGEPQVSLPEHQRAFGGRSVHGNNIGNCHCAPEGSCCDRRCDTWVRRQLGVIGGVVAIGHEVFNVYLQDCCGRRGLPRH